MSFFKKIKSCTKVGKAIQGHPDGLHAPAGRPPRSSRALGALDITQQPPGPSDAPRARSGTRIGAQTATACTEAGDLCWAS